jgi:anti-anti-sigma factor
MYDLGLGISQVTLAGRLDISTAREADRVLRASQDEAPLVVLDLRQLQFVGCTAARVALMADARARRAGGRLVVLATGAPRPLFSLARLHRRLEIVDRFPGARSEGDPR